MAWKQPELNKYISKQLLLGLWLAGCLAVATFLRLYNLGGPSIWVDELNHYYAAKGYAESGAPVLPSGELYPRASIYSRMVSWSFVLFGQNEFAMRFPSAVIGLGCIGLAFWLVRRYWGNLPACLVAFFLAITPFEIGWARISRMYTAFQFLTLLAAFAFYRGFESHKGSAREASFAERLKLSVPYNWLNRNGIHAGWLFILLIVLWISYTIHQLTALFAVGIIFYCLFMALITWRNTGVKGALLSKYFVVLASAILAVTAVVLLSPGFVEFLEYSLMYAPKWADMSKFQNRMLFVDFLFNEYNVPLGTLFLLGVYQVFLRHDKFGILLASLTFGVLFMFVVVFSYRHLQYMYSVFAFVTMLSAFSLGNFISNDVFTFTVRWMSKIDKSSLFAKSAATLCLLALFVITPTVRFAKAIPNIEGNFNGAIYLTEWREACDYVRQHATGSGPVISTDALGTQHYLGRVDYNLNFADLDQSREHELIGSDGKLFDLYSGKPFVENLTDLQELIQSNDEIWFLADDFKIHRAEVYVPIKIRNFILQNFELAYKTPNSTVVVYRSRERHNDEQNLNRMKEQGQL